MSRRPSPAAATTVEAGARSPRSRRAGVLTPAAGGGLTELTRICELIAAGDLEQRVPFLGADPEMLGIRAGINHLIDVVDAFVREAQASLAAASRREFERTFLLEGMPGSFRVAAAQINAARRAITEAAARDAEQSRARAKMVDTAFGASQIVASAAVELSTSAAVLSETAREAVASAQLASRVVEHLERSAEGIEQAISVIAMVASQTRMLALNATIEAARAGPAGRSFAVVANEVKTLADQTADANQQIYHQVEITRTTAHEAIGAITSIAGKIQQMDAQVEEIARAAGGGENIEGLAQMAERLHTETSRLIED